MLGPLFLCNIYCALLRSNEEKIQKRATKFIVETGDSYDTRLKKLSLKHRGLIILADATLKGGGEK